MLSDYNKFNKIHKQPVEKGAKHLTLRKICIYVCIQMYICGGYC